MYYLQNHFRYSCTVIAPEIVAKCKYVSNSKDCSYNRSSPAAKTTPQRRTAKNRIDKGRGRISVQLHQFSNNCTTTLSLTLVAAAAFSCAPATNWMSCSVVPTAQLCIQILFVKLPKHPCGYNVQSFRQSVVCGVVCGKTGTANSRNNLGEPELNWLTGWLTMSPCKAAATAKGRV